MAVGGVMKMLSGPVQDVIGQVTQQMNVLDDVQGQISGFPNGLGDAWTGDDAEAFIEEVTTRLLPEIAALIAAIAGMPGGIGGAMDMIHGADSKGQSASSGLGDMFGGIF